MSETDHPVAPEPLYTADHIIFLEALWGDGVLSPGGLEEVERMLDGIDFAGERVLDIGCGSGGITVSLTVDHGAAEVVGIDVEAPVCEAARRRIERSGVADRVAVRLVDPGPLPFPASRFGRVFSKDSIVHIVDKRALASEAFRVLTPGGWFVAADWLISHDGEPSTEMLHYLELEDLDFGMASPGAYRDALESAGFEHVELRNRNQWYREEARRELARLQGPERAIFEDAVGADEIDLQVVTWEAMLVVVDSGEHCPHHFRARKPTAG